MRSKDIETRHMERDFYRRVCLAVLTSAIEDARRLGSASARTWLESDYAGHIADGAGLDPAYFRRVVPNAWTGQGGVAKKKKMNRRGGKSRTKEEIAASKAANAADKAARERAKRHGLTRRQMKFVDAFRESGDTEEAMRTARVTRKTVTAWLRKDELVRLMYAERIE